jgi:hypothetical protein
MRKLAQLVDDILERGIRGSFVEAGAWKGANGILVRKLFDAASDVADQMRKVYSLDTFAWFPNKTNSTYYADRGIVEGFYASGRWHPNFYADLRKVKQIHTQFGINLQYGGLKLLDGDLEQLAPELAISLQSDAEKIALLVVDTNHYKGTWETLKALYAHVALGGYVLLGDYGSPPSRRAADDFRGCMGIESELVFFLPHGSPHGRHGKAYWKKTEELPPSKRLNARCEAMPSLTVGFGASQDVSFVVAHETKLGEGKDFPPVMRLAPLTVSARPTAREAFSRAARSWSSAKGSSCFVDVLLYGLIRSDAMLEYTTPTLRSHGLEPLEGHGCLHVHAYCLEARCNMSTASTLLRRLGAASLNVTAALPPPALLGKRIELEWNARDPSLDAIARMIARDARKRRSETIHRWRCGVHSLSQAWAAARLHTPAKYGEAPSGLVLVCRIDAAFVARPAPIGHLPNMDLIDHLWASDAWEAHERHTVFVPDFQHYGGLNDRFVFGSAAAVAMLISAREEQSRLGETFAEQAMCSAVLEHNLSVRTTTISFVRVRDDNSIPPVDSETILSNASALGTTPDTRWWNGHSNGMCLSCVGLAGRCLGSEEAAAYGLNPYHSFCPGQLCQLLTSMNSRLGALVDRAQLAGLHTLARSRPAMFAAFNRRIARGTKRTESMLGKSSPRSRRGKMRQPERSTQPSDAQVADAKKAQAELDALVHADLELINQAERESRRRSVLRPIF